ncbi:MAG: helix-turn-helix transcriptional regulator [Bacteroidota bacterium]
MPRKRDPALKATNRLIGDRIRKLRQLQKLSTTALGAKLGITGAQVGKYETGRDNISAARLVHIAKALNRGAGYFYLEVE